MKPQNTHPLVEKMAAAMHYSETKDDWQIELDEYKEPYLDLADAAFSAVEQAIVSAKFAAFEEGRASGWRSAREESEMNGMVGDLYHPHTEVDPNPYEDRS